MYIMPSGQGRGRGAALGLRDSRDTSHGVWVWLPAFGWLLDFVAHLVRQLRLIPVLLQYKLRAIQVNVHAVQFFNLVQLTKASFK